MPAVTPREAHRNRPEVAAPAEAKRSSGNGDRRPSVADEGGGVEAEGDVDDDDDDVPEVASSFVFPDRSLVDVARVIVERRATRTRRDRLGARPTPCATRALVAAGIAVAPEDVRSRCARAKKNETFPVWRQLSFRARRGLAVASPRKRRGVRGAPVADADRADARDGSRKVDDARGGARRVRVRARARVRVRPDASASASPVTENQLSATLRARSRRGRPRGG